MRLDGKVSIITGAGSGMGRAAARLFAREGSRLGLIDVDEAALRGTATAIRADGGEVIEMVGDVSRAADVEGLVRTTVSAFGRLDVLYNNAAIYWPHRGDSPVDELDEAIWDAVVAVNLKGVYLGAKFAIPEMIRSGSGSVINTASLAGTRGSRQSHAYAAAKGGVISLTLSLAVTYGPANIRANAIAPGPIDTPMYRAPQQGIDLPTTAMMPHLPLGRVGEPHEVANVALFLASDESSYVSGTVQLVDGGFTLG
ncbi:MAG TPA: SDR family NAD(P)-dependent oxidoreductase [Acidimicrobiales bacterium]|jgi:NAD(P)-dependent dehydrogenase (short-subunit alcohol dehydrogenase family)|nr:SDR family NAD(P)-dependent oxidoreductase [Acidimicrobiales bacterium]